MSIIRIAIPVIALFVGGWLTFDGARALVSGDYVTARSGPNAGRLGPWSKIVSAIGVEPRSTGMKCFHVILGILWLISAAMFFARPRLGWLALAGCSISSLWYLPVGTVLSLIELGLLFLPFTRNLK
ncbi:MAG TPA: hypothetical protein VHO24_12755 [Opitutaceae bacterium]|nr:hypothetical protein [Opitutaceae bacterium]